MKKDKLLIRDLKDMLNKTKELYGERPAYKIRIEEGKYKIITHREVRAMVDALGTTLISLGLKGKKIAVIGENRYEWGVSYLAVVCGTGIVVPLDKSLPANELEYLIERSGVEAIFFAPKYTDAVTKIKNSGKNNLKYLITMSSETAVEGVLTQEELIQKGKELIKEGDREFLDAEINAEEMSIMLFTSGTTSEPKVVALCHRNICSNLMAVDEALQINETDRVLSFLPMHHVFECTAEFLYSLYAGSEMAFCDGMRHIIANLNEYKTTYVCFVPAIYESMYKNIIKKLEAEDRREEIRSLEEKYKDASMSEKKQVFQEIHDMLGGEIRVFVSGAAALDKEVHRSFRNWGINLCQGYGLTETSPVVAIESETVARVGSIGKALSHVEVKLCDVDDDGMGELMVKGPNVMLGYYNNEEATNEVMEDGWFHTGDLAKIDEDGYIFICGRKKNVIVLKNGKNIFPEEMEILINRIKGVKESFVFGKQKSDDKEDVKINVKIVFDREIMKEVYNAQNEEEIYKALWEQIKEINKIMPKYKAIRGISLTEEQLIKTTTNKIKRQENLRNI